MTSFRVTGLAALALVGAGSALLGACASAPPAGAQAQRAPALAGLDAQVAAGVAVRRYPGAVFAVARGDDVLALDAVGVSDIATGAPMRIDSIFPLMSMTKPVTATAAMILVQEGRLDLDAPVSAYLPEFANFGVSGAPPLTLRSLLTHTSGIGFGSLPMEPVTLEARVRATAARTMRVPVGRTWAYSGVEGPDVIVRVIEVAAGQPYDQFVKARIFEPLGMVDTGYSLTAEQRSRLVGLYAAQDGAIVDAPPMFPELTYASGGAGLYSTVPDYLRLARMFANDGALGDVRVLTPASVAEMRKLQLPAGFPGLPSGIGSGLLMRVVADPAAANSPLPAGAYGWSGAYGTHFWVDPATGLTAVWMISLTTAGGAGSEDALNFERLVTAACAHEPRCGGR